LVGLLPRDFRRAGAVLEESQAPPFFMKNDFYKMFGKATSKKPEPVEPPAKEGLRMVHV